MTINIFTGISKSDILQVMELICLNTIELAERMIKDDSEAILDRVKWEGKPWLDWNSIRKIEAVLTLPCDRDGEKECSKIMVKRVVYFGPKATLFDKLFSNLRKSCPDMILGMREYLIFVSF